MTTRNPHYDTIVAWAEGKPIQCYTGAKWRDIDEPMWAPGNQYRVKPKPRTVLQIYTEAAYPKFDGKWGESAREPIERGLQAVINAVKSGELS